MPFLQCPQGTGEGSGVTREGIHVRDNHGLERMINDLERLSDALGSEKTRARLDSLTAELTEELRAVMPVRTGALKASGHWTSEHSAEHYEGTVTFGGAMAPYAPYVIGRGVDGAHAWDAVLPAMEQRFEDEIQAIWSEAMDL